MGLDLILKHDVLQYKGRGAHPERLIACPWKTYQSFQGMPRVCTLLTVNLRWIFQLTRPDQISRSCHTLSDIISIRAWNVWYWVQHKHLVNVWMRQTYRLEAKTLDLSETSSIENRTENQARPNKRVSWVGHVIPSHSRDRLAIEVGSWPGHWQLPGRLA